jgi:HPr kinase/phosphorylase
MRLHASCAARPAPDGYDAVLLLGEPGAGKSDLLLRLLDAGFQLVADDQVLIEHGLASAPAALAGLLEVRGLGIFRLTHIASARLRLAIRLGVQPARLPTPELHSPTGLPLITLDPAAPSAAARVSLALDAALGRVTQLAGALPA